MTTEGEKKSFGGGGFGGGATPYEVEADVRVKQTKKMPTGEHEVEAELTTPIDNDCDDTTGD